jgi:hypothetical protein
MGSLRLIAAIVTAVVVAGFAGVAWAHSGATRSTTVVPERAAPATAARATAAPATDWTALMSQLDAQRDTAFARGDVAMLDRVYALGTRVAAIDLAALRSLVTHHLHARGLHLVIASVRVNAATATSATLVVVDRLPAYDIVDRDNHVAVHHLARGLHTWHVGLVRSDAGWRIATIA